MGSTARSELPGESGGGTSQQQGRESDDAPIGHPPPPGDDLADRLNISGARWVGGFPE